MAGRKPYTPTPEQRKQVETMSAYGIPGAEIAKVLGIHRATLDRHYREELDRASTMANAKVAGFLYKNAEAGNVTAQIFWLKTRARWKEPPAEHKHSGAVGQYDLTKVSDADLKRLEAILGAAALGGDTGGDPETGG
ncbi:hypothetical protein [Pseudorhodoplanes sp.]|uniref:hypothetical protein n=1 Tax=Pseudorhodoplanes sp. TaxID=1934341 RepID=UPI002BEAF06C|nr:hypothetical protein [Pseudorhodoplanes sp.]HWV44106.1 hypothetical protein [Pseudorhodoplanes sp.]